MFTLVHGNIYAAFITYCTQKELQYKLWELSYKLRGALVSLGVRLVPISLVQKFLKL